MIAGTCVSDARLKTDIRPFAPVLDKLVQLQPVHFRWIREEYPELQRDPAIRFGLIAQEAKKLIPDLVTTDREGFRAVRYGNLPLLMLQAIKEQQEQLKQLRLENVDLRARLERVERLVRDHPSLTASAELPGGVGAEPELH